MKLLVVNPNTTEAVTELLAGRVRAIVGAAVDVEAITARFGSAHIASEARYAIAAHAALDRRIGKRPCAGSVFADPRGGSAATIDS